MYNAVCMFTLISFNNLTHSLASWRNAPPERRQLDDNPSKLSKTIVDEFGIPCSTLSTILKEKEKYRQQYSGGEENVATLRFIGLQLQDIDQALCWFTEARFM